MRNLAVCFGLCPRQETSRSTPILHCQRSTLSFRSSSPSPRRVDLRAWPSVCRDPRKELTQTLSSPATAFHPTVSGFIQHLNLAETAWQTMIVLTRTCECHPAQRRHRRLLEPALRPQSPAGECRLRPRSLRSCPPTSDCPSIAM